jgi:hypothetical protein
MMGVVAEGDCRLIEIPWVVVSASILPRQQKTPPWIEAAFIDSHSTLWPRAVSGATRKRERNVYSKNSWMAWLQVAGSLSTASAPDSACRLSPTSWTNGDSHGFFVAIKLINW